MPPGSEPDAMRNAAKPPCAAEPVDVQVLAIRPSSGDRPADARYAPANRHPNNHSVSSQVSRNAAEPDEKNKKFLIFLFH